MKNRERKPKEKRNKPFIPKAPGSKKPQKQEKDDPNPNSDPNYSYFPNGAYPTGDENKNP